MYGNPIIRFKGGAPVKNVEEALYLGVTLNKKVHAKQELQQIIRHVIITWKS